MRVEWIECVRLLAFAHEGDLRGKKGCVWARGARSLASRLSDHLSGVGSVISSQVD